MARKMTNVVSMTFVSCMDYPQAEDFSPRLLFRDVCDR